MGQHTTASGLSLPGWGNSEALEAWLIAAGRAALQDISVCCLDPDAFMPGLAARRIRAALLPETLPGAAAAAFLGSFRAPQRAPLVVEGPGLERCMRQGMQDGEASGALLLCRSLVDLEPLAAGASGFPVVAVLRDLGDAREPSVAMLDWAQGCNGVDIVLRQEGERLRILLLARGVGADTLAEALRECLPADWSCDRLRRDLPLASGLGGLTSLTVNVGASGLAGSRAAGLRALDLIHDGDYRGEGDANYSWIWTGPSAHFRIYVGQLAPTGGEARVCIASTRDPRNLDEAAILLDGRRLAHRLDRWSPTSGKITAALPPGAGPHSVLSIVVPVMANDDTGSRRLGVCIDKVEIEA